MARSPAQSDFVVSFPAPPAHDAGEDAARDPAAVGRPVARLASAASEPSDRLVRWVLRITFFVLLVGALLILIGPHIPAGE